jgi:predicted dehydrogenase
MAQRVKWGILSTANIGTQKVIPAMQQGDFCEIIAISSRSMDKAKTAAKELDIPRAYGSYEDLLADPDIEAIYNPLPNHLHVPWSIKALEAGKHVLCEKPIALTSEEAESLVSEAENFPDLKIMEAFMYRHHPQWQQAKTWVENGKIGELRTIQSFFSYHNMDPDNIRNKPEIGGGGIMDIGCYNISLSRFIFDAEPQQAIGIIDYDPNFHTDRLGSGILDFGRGTSTFTYSTQLQPYQRANILGTKGRIEIEIPFNAPPDAPCKIWLIQGSEVTPVELDAADQYTIQGDLFSKAIINDSRVPTPLSDAVKNMQVIEAMVESGKTSTWIEL